MNPTADHFHVLERAITRSNTEKIQVSNQENNGVADIRGVHGPGWVALGDFFDPTQKFGLVGLVTQPNPKFFTTQPNPTSIFGLGCQIFFF